ncbi:MAG TPA: DUF4159 domain-containing protein [Fimbriimonadaceae bacterium]|nr:DUF4159 domain-containing protein [Fimbriimonadaceae bacterium]
MPIEEMIARRITGISPFNELPIDAEIWREAHGQHNVHRQLHAIAAHRPGIVFGLEVVVSKKERTVIVAPGVGIDSEGRTLLLSEPATFLLEEKGQIYITISYEDNVDAKSAITVGSGKKYFRLVEGRQVIATKDLPKGAYLELARIDRSAKEKAVKEAANPFDPCEDELNLLYRQVAFPHCYADGGVGELVFLPKADPSAWKPNRAGLYNLVREANGCGFHVEFTGLYNLRAPTEPAPLLLYVAACGEFQPLSDEQVTGLKKYLDAGGTLFAEASKGDAGFVKGFAEVAKKVGATPKKIAAGSPLLTAHHMFPTPPAGGQDKGEVQADLDKGVILSTFDYGAAWQGEVDSRDKVRNAQEFGHNIIAFAAQRRRLAELARM